MAEDKKEDGMGTLKKDRTLSLRDERKMEKLKAKLHTDDDCECRSPVPAAVGVVFHIKDSAPSGCAARILFN